MSIETNAIFDLLSLIAVLLYQIDDLLVYWDSVVPKNDPFGDILVVLVSVEPGMGLYLLNGKSGVWVDIENSLN